MKIFKNLFGNGDKINASEIAYKEKMTNKKKVLDDELAYGVSNKIALAGGTIDPNTAEVSLILTDHKNCPKPEFYFITTYFYGNTSAGSNKSQLAVGYKSTSLYVRNCIEGIWGAWVEK